MYSGTDIDSAVVAGVLRPEAATTLRSFVASSPDTPAVDDESFRLLTGFNDIFVPIAIALVLAAMAWIGQSIWPPLGGMAVVAVAWGWPSIPPRAAA
jgi:hypothetical protein